MCRKRTHYSIRIRVSPYSILRLVTISIEHALVTAVIERWRRKPHVRFISWRGHHDIEDVVVLSNCIDDQVVVSPVMNVV